MAPLEQGPWAGLGSFFHVLLRVGWWRRGLRGACHGAEDDIVDLHAHHPTRCYVRAGALDGYPVRLRESFSIVVCFCPVGTFDDDVSTSDTNSGR